MSAKGVISLSSTPSEALTTTSLGYQGGSLMADCYIINNPIILQGCNLKNVKTVFFMIMEKNGE